jgi:hypothetical protein
MVVAIAGMFIGILQALIVLILNGIKNDIKEIWTRVYDHYHEVQCGNPDCQKLMTGNVIVPGAKR